MNNKLVIGLCVVVALIAGVVGYSFARNGGSFGAGITASNALNQQRLINEFAALASSTANIAQGSATQNNASIATSTSVTGTITVTGAVAKDGCFVGLSTTTAFITASCQITSANTATYYLVNSSSTAITLATTTVFATNLPNATFIAPTGL